MKKLDSNQDKDSLLEELKRLRKENKKLASQKDKICPVEPPTPV